MGVDPGPALPFSTFSTRRLAGRCLLEGVSHLWGVNSSGEVVGAVDRPCNPYGLYSHRKEPLYKRVRGNQTGKYILFLSSQLV
jgi:hypothetical protein